MMTVAFCKVADRGMKRKLKKPSLLGKTTSRGSAHIPEGNTAYTLCGQVISHRAEVEENDESLNPCKTCISRLGAIQRKNPQRVAGLLGNPQLPPAII